mmetsp:Transcript_17669/g.46631  ORF Transcript_17669/g.46631 Transcript_17669/m.46631 type:complete len:367 (+) Transcript_17669:1037-2137(+)
MSHVFAEGGEHGLLVRRGLEAPPPAGAPGLHRRRPRRARGAHDGAHPHDGAPPYDGAPPCDAAHAGNARHAGHADAASDAWQLRPHEPHGDHGGARRGRGRHQRGGCPDVHEPAALQGRVRERQGSRRHRHHEHPPELHVCGEQSRWPLDQAVLDLPARRQDDAPHARRFGGGSCQDCGGGGDARSSTRHVRPSGRGQHAQHGPARGQQADPDIAVVLREARTDVSGGLRHQSVHLRRRRPVVEFQSSPLLARPEDCAAPLQRPVPGGRRPLRPCLLAGRQAHGVLRFGRLHQPDHAREGDQRHVQPADECLPVHLRAPLRLRRQDAHALPGHLLALQALPLLQPRDDRAAAVHCRRGSDRRRRRR